MEDLRRQFQILVAIATLQFVVSDYRCLCNYNVELAVHESSSRSSPELGYMYEFDCKPLMDDVGIPGWLIIAFEKKKGYVEDGSNIDKQTCIGSIPKEDKIESPSTTTATTPTSTTSQSTQMPSTTLLVNLTGPSVGLLSTIKSTESSTAQHTTTADLVGNVTTNKIPATGPVSSLSSSQMLTSTTTSTVTSTTTSAASTTMSSTTSMTLTTTTPTVPTTYTTTSTTTSSTTPMTTTTTTPTVPTTSTTTSTTTSSTTPTTSTTRPATISTTTSTITRTSSTTTPTTSTTSPTTTHKALHGTDLCPSQVINSAKTNGAKLAQFGSNCYEVSQDLVSWTNAEVHCLHNGGQLMHIANKNEQDFIYKFLVQIHSHTVWIGLHDRNKESSFEWTSGIPVTYTNWVPDRQVTWSDVDDCTYITGTGQWKDSPCDMTGYHHGYVCQYDTVDKFSVNGNIDLCPSYIRHFASIENGTAAYFNNSCYTFIPRNMSWIHADGLCHSRGGDLATITNAAEQDFIQTFLRRYSGTRPVWIGLNDIHNEGHFRWSSGSHSQYTNWVPDHVDNKKGHDMEDCVAVITSQDGKWDDIQCGSYYSLIDRGRRLPSICQYKLPAAVGAASLIG